MEKRKFIQGVVKRHPDGFGFLIPDQSAHPDVYIPRNSMSGIMSSDRVMVAVEKEKGSDRYRGEILRVVQRGLQQVVGVYSRLNDQWGLIKDDSLAWGKDLKIKVTDSMNAKPGELVAAQIIQYPEEGQDFIGKVKQVIGTSQEPMNDIIRVAMTLQIPSEFPTAVLKEAKSFPMEPHSEEFVHRKDVRSLKLITIDGKTAKDFDDAVYVEKHPQGFRLLVAIADVSHYVEPGTAIDKEAYLRGTSVYFPNFVIPMLPEVLSNGLCSLMPHVPRLCVVSEMIFSHQGDMLQSQFYEAVMQSHARVTYGEAQEVVEGRVSENLKQVQDNILLCADLAKILMAKRFREGSLDLEIPETELEIDAMGVPVDVIRSERLFAHRLIEELMLAANISVARFFNEKQIPALFRIHEPPHEMALSQLERYLRQFGSRVKLQAGGLQKRLTQALQEFQGQPQAQVLHIMTLRSMNQAKYHMNNVGHFGLGFSDYTHFTSPIRRYPDLIVHRLLKNLILPQSKYRLMSEDELLSAGTHLSACEQRSVKAERQVMAIKKARFMEKHVGQTFEGMITSVAKFGVFVLLREFDIDGLIRLEDLAKEKLQFDEEQLKLIARRSGLTYQIGDTLKIFVDAVDIDLGQINFKLAEKVEPQKFKSTDVSQAEESFEDAGDFKLNFRKGRNFSAKKSMKASSSSSLKVPSSSNGERSEKIGFKSRQGLQLKVSSNGRFGKVPGRKKNRNRNEKAEVVEKVREQSREEVREKEKQFGSQVQGQSVRKDSQKRSQTQNNRQRLRKARVSRTR